MIDSKSAFIKAIYAGDVEAVSKTLDRLVPKQGNWYDTYVSFPLQSNSNTDSVSNTLNAAIESKNANILKLLLEHHGGIIPDEEQLKKAPSELLPLLIGAAIVGALEKPLEGIKALSDIQNIEMPSHVSEAFKNLKDKQQEVAKEYAIKLVKTRHIMQEAMKYNNMIAVSKESFYYGMCTKELVRFKLRHGRTLLHLDMMAPKEIDALLSIQGIDVNAQDDYGQTPLHLMMHDIAVNKGINIKPANLKKLLMCKDINLNIQDNLGNTPIHELCMKSETESEKNCEDDEFYGTDEQLTKEYYLKPILANNNFDMYIKNKENKTALDLALQSENPEVIALLVAHTFNSMPAEDRNTVYVALFKDAETCEALASLSKETQLKVVELILDSVERVEFAISKDIFQRFSKDYLEGELLKLSSVEQVEFVNAKIVLQEFSKNVPEKVGEVAVLKLLIGDLADKAEVLLTKWLRTTNDMLKDTEDLKVFNINVRQNNCLKFEVPKYGIVRLKINSSNLTQDDLKAIARKIESGRRIHSVTIIGDLEASFLESLYNVDFIRADKNSELAEQINYRNQLIEQLGILVQPNTDMWPEIIKKWAKIINDNGAENASALYLIKPFNNGYISHYISALKLGITKLWSTNARGEYYLVINACVLGMGELFFKKMLGQLENAICSYQKNLTLNKKLTEDEIELLSTWISKNPQLPFTQLTLTVDEELIASKPFGELMKILEIRKLASLQLCFLKDHWYSFVSSDIESSLIAHVVPYANCPVYISGAVKYAAYNTSQLKLGKFEALMIERIRQYTKERYGRNVPSITAVLEEPNTTHSLEGLSPLLQIEHVEVLEVAQQQQVQQEVIVEVNVQQEVDSTYAQYDGELVDYKAFKSRPYYAFNGFGTHHLYELIEKEFFGNLPHAIKYFSVGSAIEVSANLRVLAACNASNIFANSDSKKTSISELMLDYDEYSRAEPKNPYTPRITKGEEDERVIYKIEDLTEDKVRAFINKGALSKIKWFESVFSYSPLKNPKQLINLWIKYDDKGCHHLFNQINECDIVHSGFASFLYKSYLKHFYHWDQFLDDDNFVNSLKRIELYTEAQVECLKKFLKDTGSSKYELKDALDAFDLFWSELSELCKKDDVDINLINKGSWSTPEGGYPGVYMERLITILKNARSLDEQLKWLNFKLDNYGAYYASKYEGFKIVSEEMGFVYDKVAQDKKPFNPNAMVYRVELDELVAGVVESKDYGNAEYYFKRRIEACVNALNSCPSIEKAMSEIGMNYDAYKKNAETEVTRIINEKYLYVEGRDQIRIFLEAFISKCGYKENIPAPILEEYDKNIYCKLTRYYLINSSEDTINKTDSKKLKVIPYSRNAFKAPYRLYVYDEKCFQVVTQSPLLSNDVLIKLAHRFVGQQKCGITLTDFIEDLNKASWVARRLLQCLFFVTHERYTGQLGLIDLLESVGLFKGIVFKSLLELYKCDIKLNELEGYAMLLSLGHMTNFGMAMPCSEQDAISKLFKHLRENKYGSLKLLTKFSDRHLHSWSYVYALDSAEYFVKDEGANIGIVYREDLLLFSALLNNKIEEVYHHNLKKNTSRIAEVKSFLLKAANGEKPNNLDYAVRIITESREFFGYAKCLKAFEEIEKLKTYDAQAVLRILEKHGFLIKPRMPEVFLRDNTDIKNLMIPFIFGLKTSNLSVLVNSLPNIVNAQEKKAVSPKSDIDDVESRKAEIASVTERNKRSQYKLLEYTEALQALVSKHEQAQQNYLEACELRTYLDQLQKMSIKELQKELNSLWESKGAIISSIGSVMMRTILSDLKKCLIADAVKKLGASELMCVLGDQLGNLSNFTANSFDEVSHIAEESEKLVDLICRLKVVKGFDEVAFKAILQDACFSKLDYDALYLILSLLTEMPNINYLGVFERLIKNYTLVANKDDLREIIRSVKSLYRDNFPKHYIEDLTNLFAATSDKTRVLQFESIVKLLFAKNNKDELLAFIIQNTNLGFDKLFIIGNCTQAMKSNSKQITKLLSDLRKLGKLDGLLGVLANNSRALDIITKCHSMSKLKDYEQVNYAGLFISIIKLKEEDFNKLYALCETTPPNTACLENALHNKKIDEPFDDFLLRLEREPFGKVDLEMLFDVSQVERVINESMYLDTQTKFTYKYRKELMEAFLFVNAAGKELPIYNGRPAHALSNTEIRELLKQVKAGTLPQSTNPVMKKLYVLAILRVAMYRATGQQPYSTQMILLIDRIMRGRYVISNFDTGEGKSLVEIMQCSISWLYEGGKVYGTTASIPDAKRDLEEYGSYLELLDIPTSRAPICANSKYEEFAKDGVYMSTFPELSLFLGCAITNGIDIASQKFSLVISESDKDILDGRVIYRYATSLGAPVGYADVWVYNVINKYVGTNIKGIEQGISNLDIKQLKECLKRTAAQNKRAAPKFDDEQLLTWIRSACLERFILREKYDYVLTPDKETKRINGQDMSTRAVKILMPDGRISPNTQYGEGAHQLLYAYLNEKNNNNDFIIEPENKTIWASNDKNLIDLCKSSGGSIYGSSATTGSKAEIQWQQKTHGFTFSKIAPHKKNIVVLHPVSIVKQDEHFEEVYKQIKKNQATASLIYCKDINTVIALEQWLSQRGLKQIQTFTAFEDEEKLIKQAAQPAQITLSTGALGRNANIDMKGKPLNVYQLFPSSERNTWQMGGRTGRQGGPGNIYHIYSEEDSCGKEELDVHGVAQRAENERLFNIIGCFNNAIAKILPKNKEALSKWSEFRDSLEKRYRKQPDSEDFYSTALNAFKQQFAPYDEDINNITINPPEYAVPEEYTVFSADVKLGDCTSPSVIANELLEYKKTDTTPTIQGLFDLIKHKGFEKWHVEYYKAIKSYGNVESVRLAQTEFVNALLKQEILASKGRWFFERWLGSSSLSNIASNKDYLLAFKTLNNIQGAPVAALDAIKDSVITLLDEYLDNSWWRISSCRKAEAIELKKLVAVSETYDGIVKLLEASKVKMFTSDLKEKSFWRSIKPIHLFGKSRFQDTLESALELTSALSGQTNNTLASQLLGTLGIDVPKQDFDSLSLLASTAQQTSTTAKMILDNIRKAINNLAVGSVWHRGL